jgi:hypothetical protein
MDFEDIYNKSKLNESVNSFKKHIIELRNGGNVQAYCDFLNKTMPKQTGSPGWEDDGAGEINPNDGNDTYWEWRGSEWDFNPTMWEDEWLEYEFGTNKWYPPGTEGLNEDDWDDD